MKIKQILTTVFILVALLVTVKAAVAVPTVSAIEFNDVDRSTGVTTTFTVTNDQATAINNMQFQLVGVAAKYNARLTAPAPLPTTLAAGATTTVTLTIDVPIDEDSGRRDLGDLEITSSAGTQTTPIFLNAKSFLAITKIEVNGKTSGDLSIEEVNEIEVTVENEHPDLDIEDINVEVRILDVDGDDIEEDDDLGDLRNNGDDDRVTLDFDLRNEEVDEESYTIEIIVEGDDEEGALHRTVLQKEVDVDIERHKLVIQRTSLGLSVLQDLRQTNLRVEIKNIGKSDEEDIRVVVTNAALGLNLERSNLELDDFSRSDNEETVTFNLDLEGAEAGTYPLTVEVFRDEDELEDRVEVILEVRESSTNSGSSQQTIDVETQRTIENLQRELEQALQQNRVQQEQTNNPVNVQGSFRNTSAYNVLIGVLAFLTLVALVLAVVVLVKKR